MNFIGKKAYYRLPLCNELKESRVESSREFFNLAGNKITLLKMENGDEESDSACYFNEPVKETDTGAHEDLRLLTRDFIMPELERMVAAEAKAQEKRPAMLRIIENTGNGVQYQLVYESDLNRKIFKHVVAGSFAASLFFWISAGCLAYLATEFGWF